MRKSEEKRRKRRRKVGKEEGKNLLLQSLAGLSLINEMCPSKGSRFEITISHNLGKGDLLGFLLFLQPELEPWIFFWAIEGIWLPSFPAGGFPLGGESGSDDQIEKGEIVEVEVERKVEWKKK